MAEARRSACPINLTLEALGDRWSLIVIRDIIFGNRRHFRELLNQSEERIASNILSDRLKRLTDSGFLSRSDDPSHKQKAIYSLTEKAIQLVPLLVAMATWGRHHTAASQALAVRAKLLEEGGPCLWSALMDELRASHLHAQDLQTQGVIARLQGAYEAEQTRAQSLSPHRESQT